MQYARKQLYIDEILAIVEQACLPTRYPIANTKLDCYGRALFDYLKTNEQNETEI